MREKEGKNKNRLKGKLNIPYQRHYMICKQGPQSNKNEIC